MARTLVKTVGGGGGNIFSGNTNLSGDYYGDVIVYGGNATVTGNLTVHGNMIVEGALLCAGNFSIDVKNDCLVNEYFDYQPGVGGQDINIGGDFYVKGKTSVINSNLGPFTITYIDDASLYVPVPPGAYTALEIAEDISMIGGGNLEVLLGEPSYPYISPILYTQPSPPLPPPNFVVINGYPTPLSIGEQWEVVSTTTLHQDIYIQAGAAINLTVGGNFYLRKLEGRTTSGLYKGLSIVVDGDVVGLRGQLDYDLNYLQNYIDISGSINSPGGGAGGDITVKGTVYDCSINTYGSNTISAVNGGKGGDVYLNSFIASYARTSFIDSKGGTKTVSSPGNGGNGGRIQIDGTLICRNIYSNGGDHSNNASASGNGGSGGYVFIYGNANLSYCYTQGGASNAILGYGGSAGNVNVYGNLSGLAGGGQLIAIGGYGTGAGRSGGSGGVLQIYGEAIGLNNIQVNGGDGYSGAVGGSAGYVSFRGSVYVEGTVSANGGSTSLGTAANGGTGGTILLNGPAIFCNYAYSRGGNSTNGGNGGNGGQIQTNGYATIISAESTGGNGVTAGNPGTMFLKYGGVFGTIRMTDGTGTAPTGTQSLNIGGHLIARTINMTNRAQLTIRGYSTHSSSLLVGTFTAKDVLSNPSGLNNSAAQAALCKDRTYVHDPVDSRWKYATLTNA